MSGTHLALLRLVIGGFLAYLFAFSRQPSPDYFGLSLEHAWTRYVGLPVSRPRDRFLHGKWDRDLAHNSEYDVAKTLELVL
eukprot:COSAG01_NODE_40104_length_467_cov_6.103261_2_plen_80_part_01